MTVILRKLSHPDTHSLHRSIVVPVMVRWLVVATLAASAGRRLVADQRLGRLLDQVQNRVQILEALLEDLVRLGDLGRIAELAGDRYGALLGLLGEQFRVSVLGVQVLERDSTVAAVVSTSDGTDVEDGREVWLVDDVTLAVLNEDALRQMLDLVGGQLQLGQLTGFVRDELVTVDQVAVLAVVALEDLVSLAEHVLAVRAVQNTLDALLGAVRIAGIADGWLEEVPDDVFTHLLRVIPGTEVDQRAANQLLDDLAVRVRIVDVLSQGTIGHLKVFGTLLERIREALEGDVVVKVGPNHNRGGAQAQN